MSFIDINLRVTVHDLPTEQGVVSVDENDPFTKLEVGQTFTRVKNIDPKSPLWSSTHTQDEEDYILIKKEMDHLSIVRPMSLTYTITPTHPPAQNLSDIWAKDISDEIDRDILDKLTKIAKDQSLIDIADKNKAESFGKIIGLSKHLFVP